MTINNQKRTAIKAMGATAAVYVVARPSVVGATPTQTSNPTRWIDVTKTPYNAANNGNSDSATAIQNAINAAYANPTSGDDGGAVVYLPAGKYRLDKTLNMHKNVWLKGDGPGTIIFPKDSGFSGSSIIYFGGEDAFEAAAAQVSDLRIKISSSFNGTVNGMDFNTLGESGDSQYRTSTSFINPDASQVIRNVSMFGITGTGMNVRRHSRGVWASNCVIQGAQGGSRTGNGVVLKGSDSNFENVTCRDFEYGFIIEGVIRRMSNCRSSDNTVGYWINWEGAQMSGCTATDNSSHGFWITGQPGHMGRTVLHGCTAYGNGGRGIYLDHAKDGAAYSAKHVLWGIQASGNSGTSVQVGRPGNSSKGVNSSMLAGTCDTYGTNWPTKVVSTAVGDQVQGAYLMHQ